MRLRDYKRHTFKVCMAWYRNPSPRNIDRLANNLRRWARGEGAPYDYSGCDLKEQIHYCSDRMNPGRAKGLLVLWDQQSIEQLLAMFA